MSEMERRKRSVACIENSELADFLWVKREELAQSPKGISENLDTTLFKAYSNICICNYPINSLKDLSQIKGIGKWTLKQVQGFFDTRDEDAGNKGNNSKRTKRYVPQKNSVAYALLITLYRGIASGTEFMHKQELIDGAEASGLSRAPIGPEKGKGKPKDFGSSQRDWYSGWNCMKTLISKGLVIKSSCPAKYMLTEEGKEAARGCISRSGLDADHSYNQELPTLGSRPMSLVAGLELPTIKSYSLALPPLDVGESFEEAYEVILILDDREHFASRGSRSSKLIDNISSQFKIKVEVRRLPVGDSIWIARHKQFHSEYVLDFIVERKKVDDLRSSIRDNRYKDQKLRLLRCGLKKMIYLVEGDPNSSEAAESIKTACFTTEILEGFDVHRTTGLGDTLRKYGHLTQSIMKYYRSLDPEHNSSSVCTPYNDFIKRCQDMEKLTVSDVFAIQLMQVPQVTEEVAMAVLDLYPTLTALAHAYSPLDGDTHAQEEMLKERSNNLINGAASRNIFQFVWGN